MKKILLTLICMAVCAYAAPSLADEAFLSLTKLNELQSSLDEGVVIEKVYYTDGYGFSTSEFVSADADEMMALYETLTAIVLGEKVNEDMTDWYPQIVFFLSDGSHYNVCFDARWLEIDGMEHYAVSGDEAFWRLTAELVEKYSHASVQTQE